MNYFVISDIHSHYTLMRKALRKAGFDKRNKNHILIVCGDILDRGRESKEVIDYLMSIPRKRRVLIRGNHESLFLELLKKEWPDQWDFSNGTVRSFCNLAGVDEEVLSTSYYFHKNPDADFAEIVHKKRMKWLQIRSIVEALKLDEWFMSDEWCNYYELDKYIFVHSFIPLGDHSTLPKHYLRGHSYYFDPNWRQSSQQEWWDAMWGCPWQLIIQGLNQTDKAIVCGHWHASDFHENLAEDPILQEDGVDPRNENEIYFGTDIIAIDACTAYSGFCNVLVIKEDHCFDQFNNPLPFSAFTNEEKI